MTLPQIDTSWTLFIDRDGVINHEKKMDYILHKNEFVFYAGVLEAMSIFNQLFGRIILVTNQRGIGKGLMTETDLHSIHQHMLAEMEKQGGRIDKIYYCTSLDNDHPNRKPNAGMAFEAQVDFPEIDFTKSLMVGNKLSDMGFARNAGVQSIYVTTTNPEVELPNPLIDFVFADLLTFAKALKS